MTHFAAVAPLDIHRGLDEVGMLGTYQLLIATEVLKDPEAHSTFWLTQQADQYIILDNGVIETGQPLPMSELVRAAKAVGANAIVLPDAIDNAEATMRLSRRAASDYADLEEAGRELIGVVQGRDWGECLDCAAGLLEVVGVDRLAIPRGLTKNLKTRSTLVAYLAETYHVLMHLLGFSDNIEDDIRSAVSNKLVIGIDAATPVWLGLQGRQVPVEPPRDSTGWGKRPGYFWSASSDLHNRDDLGFPPYETNQIVDNLERTRQWLSDAAVASPVLQHE